MTDRADRTVAVVAVDGGNSKTELALIGWDGAVLATGDGPTTSHQQVGLDAGTDALRDLVRSAGRRAGLEPSAAVGSFALAGADTRADITRLRAAIGGVGLADDVLVVNDAFAPVRAGSERGWGVGLICGAGVNGAGIAPDGRTARFAAYGRISGDWGGGGDIGLAALGAAVRGRDGRGRRTSLERVVPAYFGFRRPIDLTMAIEHGRLPQDRLRALSPVVFLAAGAGDVVAREILDRLADELAEMASAMIRRLRMTRLDADVTLAGGVFRAADDDFEARIVAGVQRVARRARVRRLQAPPVLGAALLGLDALERAGRLTSAEHTAAEHRVRRELGFGAFAGE